MKRIFFSIMVVVLCLGMLPLSAFAAVDFDLSASNGYFTVLSNKEYTLAPGVSESEIIVNNAEGSDRKIVHVLEVDATNPTVKVLPGYYGIDKLDPNNLSDKTYWTDKKLTETVAYYENQLGYNVVGAMNTALAYDSNAPYGYMVWDGVVLGTPEIHPGADTYLAIYKDGSAELRSMSTPLDGNEWTAISANFGWLVKDGKLTSTKVERTSSDASRSMIGIKPDGTLVFCQVDGRNAPVSTGLSNYEMGEMMLSLGCVNAVNCDGGGSSTFITQREGETENVMRSIPSDGAERPTINSVIIATTAVATGIFDHANIESEYDYFAAGANGKFSVVGLDSAGFVADIPAEMTLALSDASFGTIVDGVFTSNGKKGDVAVQAIYNDKVVGSKTIHVVDPDVFALTLDETVLPYGKSMTIDLNCVYGADDWEVCMDGAVTLSLSDNSAAALNGNVIIAPTDEAIKGVNVIATYNADTSFTDVLKVSFGKGSEIIWDFEDGLNGGFVGFDEAKQYSIDNGINNTLVGSDPLAGQFSEQVDGDTFVSSDIVKNGKHALAWNVDNTNGGFAGWTYNVLFNIGETIVLRDVANGKNATKLGMWLYIPEGAAGLAFQAQLYAKNENGTYTCKQEHFTFTTVSGAVKNLNSCTEADIPESRWVYASINLTAYDYICTPVVTDTSNSRSPSFIRTYVKPIVPAVHTFYIDDITLDYSSAVEDRVLPTISGVSYATQDESIALENGKVIESNSIAFSATVADNIKLDNATGKIYVDGVALDNVAVSGKYLATTSNAVLAAGTHTVKFEIKDTLGNTAVVTRTFTVEGDAAVALGGHNDSGKLPEYDSIYYVDINVADVANVNKITTKLLLQDANTWEPQGMVVANGFKATYTVDAVESILTLVIERTSDVLAASADETIVSIPVRLWSWNTFNHITGAVITPEAQFATGYCPIVSINCSVAMGQVEYVNGNVATFGGAISVETNMKDNEKPWHYHDAELTVLNKDASCFADGYANRTYCETCMSVVDWGTVIPAAHSDKHIVVNKDATCTEDGCIGREICADCNTVLVEGVVIPASGHVLSITSDFKLDCSACDETIDTTGLVTVKGYTYYAISGSLLSGWHNIDGNWHYFRSSTRRAAVGTVVHWFGDVILEFKYSEENDGRLLSGAWVNMDDGVQYYYGPTLYVHTWATIDGATYYFDDNGYRYTGYQLIKDSRYSHDDDYKLYLFADDGKLVETSSANGLFVTADGTFYLENGYAKYKGLMLIDGDYYYFGSSRKAAVGSHYVEKTNGLLAAGTYTFDEDGKLVKKNGIDGDYYYIDGVIQKTGLTKVGNDYYYFSTSNGKMRKNQTSLVEYKAANCDLPFGTYTFGADGKVVIEKKNGIIGDYYYIDGVMQMTGLTKVGNDYYYFSTSNGKMRKSQTSLVEYKAANCDLPYGTYTFGADGKVIIEKKNGIIGDYYYIDGIMQMTGLTKVGNDYYYFSTSNGKMRKSQTSLVEYKAANCDLPFGTYTFGADGKVVIEKKNGIIGDYYYIDGIVQMGGLTKVGNDYYYFSTTNGKMRKNQTSMVNYVAEGCDLSYGVYTFGADGKVVIEVKNGVIGDYYYIDGVVQMGGLTKVGNDYYYFSTTNGKMRKNQTSQVNFVAPGCDLSYGVYTFGADGKVIFA